MDSNFLLKGLTIGFLIAAPVGPIGVLCIRRTLSDGRVTGIVSGLGAATADAIYGSIAGFGLTFISNALVSMQFWLHLIGGAFLCYLGVRTLAVKPPENALPGKGRGQLSAYAVTFLLTLTNPMTIISFAAIFAGLGLVNSGGDYSAAGVLVLGVFLGSSLWWLTLSGVVGIFREKLIPRGLVWVNRISGAIIIVYGLTTLLRAGQ